MNSYSYIVDEAYEREMREKFGVNETLSVPDRTLGMAGNYLPSPGKGIYSIGWHGWDQYPAADFVKNLIEWHNGFAKEHNHEPHYPLFGPLFLKGELTKEEIKAYFSYSLGVANLAFYYEGIAHFRAHLAGAFELRDLFAWHIFEETGHNEMMADFMSGYFGMDRLEEIQPLMDPLKLAEKDRRRYERLQKFKTLNAEGDFVEIAAAAMLRERILPKPNRMRAIGLRKHYSVPDKLMTFFDVHSYIDIYHERFGAYILAKYATTKELQEKAERAFKDMVVLEYEGSKRRYETLPISKR